MPWEIIWAKLSQLAKKVADLSALSPFTYKGSVANAQALPTNAKKGEVYTTSNDGREYLYDGNAWVMIGGDSYTKSEMDQLLAKYLKIEGGNE